jgi:hypothetical protein
VCPLQSRRPGGVCRQDAGAKRALSLSADDWELTAEPDPETPGFTSKLGTSDSVARCAFKS